MNSKLNPQSLRSQLVRALSEGPPQEVCMVFEAGSLRELNEAELSSMGSTLVVSNSLPDGETAEPLGPDAPGWSITWESR